MAAFVGLVLLIGSLLPRSFETATYIVIDAPPEQVFPHINQIRMWSNWSMWNEHDIRDLKVEYSGAEAGVGAVQKWSEPRGEGKLWITESLPNREIQFSSTFGDFPKMESRIVLSPDKGKTRVRWHSLGELPGGPFYGWFGSAYSGGLSAIYDKSLEKLKRHVEQQPASESNTDENKSDEPEN